MTKKLPKQEPMWGEIKTKTLREEYAGLAMQSILAHPSVKRKLAFKEMAEDAVCCADAVIKALEENNEKQ